jgi:hypothetical protein
LLTFWQSRFADNSVSLIQNKDMGQQPFITLVDRILSITKDEDYLQNPEKQAKVKKT